MKTKGAQQGDGEHAREVPERAARARCIGGQRQPLEEAGLDVARKRRARVDHREQRRLHERHRDREVQVGVGGKPGIFVAASSPLEFTASRISGNTMGGTISAGWRIVLHQRRAARPRSRSRESRPSARRPARRPRACGRSWPGRRRRATAGAAGGRRRRMPSASSARTTSARLRPTPRSAGRRPPSGDGPPARRSARGRRHRVALGADAGTASTLGRADLGLQLAPACPRRRSCRGR